MSYLDPESGERYVPYVVEPALGVDRTLLVHLLDAYTEDEAPDAASRELLLQRCQMERVGCGLLKDQVARLGR